MIKVDKHICVRCGGCVATCPRNALTLKEHGINCSEDCNNCGICVLFCPVGAIALKDKGNRRVEDVPKDA